MPAGDGLFVALGVFMSIHRSGVRIRRLPLVALALIFLFIPRLSLARNKILGQVNFSPATKVEAGAGIWIDGEYVGYVKELKGSKQVELLPGEHVVVARAPGYMDFQEKITLEPGKTLKVHVRMTRDSRVQYSKVTSEIKIEVDPSRAAVFLDGVFAGYAHQFGGIRRSMLVNPGKHQLKIALPGYHDFVTEINLLPQQKYTIKTKLTPASITQADSPIKRN